jgi:hypothetical protein
MQSSCMLCRVLRCGGTIRDLVSEKHVEVLLHLRGTGLSRYREVPTGEPPRTDASSVTASHRTRMLPGTLWWLVGPFVSFEVRDDNSSAAR